MGDRAADAAGLSSLQRHGLNILIFGLSDKSKVYKQ